ncbi:MAG: diguanylate cyclase, partial [Gemmatimonadaceae bacterium]|nr:diguanylate cyclase [Gemmatimonadaceae bacterium]
RFALFNRANTPALRTNDVRTLFVDRAGTLWVGTYGGGTSSYRDGRFSAYTDSASLPHSVVRSFAQDRAGDLWIATQGAGAIRLRGRSVTPFTTKNGLASDQIKSVHADRAGDVWFGTFGKGVTRYHDGQFTTFTKRDGLPSDIIFGIADTPDGALWFATYGGGLSRYQGGRFVTYDTSAGLPDNRINAVINAPDGTLWLGMYDGGVVRMRDGRFESYRMRDGLTDDMVLSILADREGSIWAGTFSGGVNRFHRGRVVPYGAPEGLAMPRSFSVAEDRAGSIWVASEGAGVQRWTGTTFTGYDTRSGLSSNNAVAVLLDRRGAIWAGTFGGGLNHIVDGRVRKITSKDGLASDIVYALYEDRAGTVWVGTSGGINRFVDGLTSTDVPQGLRDPSVHAFLETRDGALWIATNGGLHRWLNHALTVVTEADGLPSNTIYSLLESRDGALWIGTKGGGLARRHNGRVFAYTAKHGLPDDIINSVIDDGRGWLWMSTARGIVGASFASLNAVAAGQRSTVDALLLDASDGLRSPEGTGGAQPSAVRARDGRLWFPTARGLVAIDPATLSRNRGRPSVLVEDVLADRKEIRAVSGMSLPAGTKTLEFRYTGLSLLAPARVRFRYQLVGFDDDWVDAETRRTAFYTNLRPGHYTFRVLASNNDGVWNDQAAVLAFTLEPFFYQTVLFRIAVALAAIAAIAILFRLRIHRLRVRERVLTRTVEEQTRELREANGRLEQLSSLDGLTAIPNRREFDRVAALEWRRAIRPGRSLSVILADVDRFKEYNDRYGHLNGDECLRQVAVALSEAVFRPTDFLARYGGEEFAFVLPETDEAGAMRVAERARALVSRLGIPHLGHDGRSVVTMSLGIATIVPTDDEQLVTLIDLADRALYAAKADGRDCAWTSRRVQ